jgi:hypothetical protein
MKVFHEWRDHLGRMRSRCVPGDAYTYTSYVRDSSKPGGLREAVLCFKCHRELVFKGHTYRWNHVRGVFYVSPKPSAVPRGPHPGISETVEASKAKVIQ